MHNKYIAIEGCIGAGKTEFAQYLAKRWNANLILEEFSDNLYLEKFYKNPDRYAFPLEVSFLVERFQQLNIAFSENTMFNQWIVSDYIFEKSLIFSGINLKKDQKHMLQSLYKTFKHQLRLPDKIIYLHRDVKKLQENIKNRGRLYEINISDSYLSGIQDAYIKYLRKLSDRLVVLFIDLSSIDFIENENFIEKIASFIEQDQQKGKFVYSEFTGKII